MALITNVLITVAVITISLQSCSSIKCFLCSSMEDSRCEDPFFDEKKSDEWNINKNNFLLDCPPDDNEYGYWYFCRKNTTMLGSYKVVNRTCDYRREPLNRPCFQTVQDGRAIFTCDCEFDGCNAASTTHTMKFLTVILA